MHYIAIIHKDADSDYGVSFPDLPGCVTAGSTVDEAKDLAAEALELHLEGIHEDGGFYPEPSSLEDIMKDPLFLEGVAFLVTYKGKPKQVRFNVSAYSDALTAIDVAAEQAGMTRSAFMVQSSLEKAAAVIK